MLSDWSCGSLLIKETGRFAEMLEMAAACFCFTSLTELVFLILESFHDTGTANHDLTWHCLRLGFTSALSFSVTVHLKHTSIC